MDITKIKLPKLSAGCFCMPLRKGVVLGYVNLVYHALLFALVLIVAAAAMFLSGLAGEVAPLEIIFLLPILVLSICIYSLLIVIAVHLNKVKLLRNVLIAGTALWIFEILYSPCLGSRILKLCIKQDVPAGFAGFLIPVILEPFFHGYMLLLLRSMILKLQEEDQTVKYVNFNKKEVDCDVSSLSNTSTQHLIK